MELREMKTAQTSLMQATEMRRQQREQTAEDTDSKDTQKQIYAERRDRQTAGLNSSPKFRFISICDSQPKSSSIKMVEVWMLGSLAQPFIDVLLQTYSEHVASQAQRGGSSQLEDEEVAEGKGKARRLRMREAHWTASTR